MEPKTYIRKPEILKAVQIDTGWREVLIEQGFTNVNIGDYYIDDCAAGFSIMRKESFENMFIEVAPVPDA